MTYLTNVRKINQAVDRCTHGWDHRYVWADTTTEQRQRIVAARTRHGDLQGRVLATGRWESIQHAYID